MKMNVCILIEKLTNTQTGVFKNRDKYVVCSECEEEYTVCVEE